VAPSDDVLAGDPVLASVDSAAKGRLASEAGR
jgi:hypothetical protein